MFTVCGLWSYDSSSLHLTEINILNSSKMNDSSKQNCGSRGGGGGFRRV